MMKKIIKIFDVLNFIVLILMLIFLVFGTTLTSMRIIDYLVFSKILSCFGIVMLVLYILYKIFHKEKFGLKDLLVLLLGVFAVISYCFAVDKNVALNGAITRHEGIFVVLTYYSIFLLSSSIQKKYQKILMFLFLMLSIYEIFIGTIQVAGIKKILGYDRFENWSLHFDFASGTIGNPNFYSTFILMALMYSLGGLIKNRKEVNARYYLILFFIFLYGLFIGNSLSCIFSFICIIHNIYLLFLMRFF